MRLHYPSSGATGGGERPVRERRITVSRIVRIPPVSLHQPVEFNPGAAILAWLWPGAGHISLGQRKRGGLIMFGVLFLVLLGILIGGFDCVDRREDRLWFLAQGCCGPITFAADWVNQQWIKGLPDEERVLTTGVSHVGEMGTLFVALAGLMNLVVVLDALVYTPRPESEPVRQERRSTS
jgi:hypothetical protein